MTEHEQTPKKRGPLTGLRANFLTGLVVVLPISLTLYLIWSAIGWIDNWVLPFVPDRYHPFFLTGYDIRGAGVIIFLVFTILVGWLAKGLIGRQLIHWGERIVDRMPVVRSLYNGLKQIAETVFAQTETSFDRAVLVEYPRRGIWAIGFVSTNAKGEISGNLTTRHEVGGPVASVFLPTTPNPTSGFLLFVPVADLIYLDMSVEDAAKLVISAGLVYPNAKDPTKPPAVVPQRPDRAAE
jgi:uncharacterized membrane protein